MLWCGDREAEGQLVQRLVQLWGSNLVIAKALFYTRVSASPTDTQFSSVAHSCPTLQPHGPQQKRNPSPSPTPRVHPNPCPLSQWCHPTISSCHLLFLLPSIFPNTRVFSNESALCIRWPKYWSFSFNISPSNENPGPIFIRMDWLDLPAVQGTLKSLLQHHSSKSSILQHPPFRLHFLFSFYALEKEMETHSNVLAWKIPGMGEPGGLPSMGLHRVGHD